MLNQNMLQTIRPADLPSPPRTALAILRACTSTEVSSQQLAQLISNDPLLTAELAPRDDITLLLLEGRDGPD